MQARIGDTGQTVYALNELRSCATPQPHAELHDSPERPAPDHLPRRWLAGVHAHGGPRRMRSRWGAGGASADGGVDSRADFAPPAGRTPAGAAAQHANRDYGGV